MAGFFWFGPLMGSLGLLGLVYSYRRRRWYFWFASLAFTCAGPFFAIITNLNLASRKHPPILIAKNRYQHLVLQLNFR